MKARGWLNLFLLGLVVALGVAVYFKRQAAQESTYPLSRLKPAEAVDILIEKPGSPALHLQKQHGIWHITAPFAARAETLMVERVLALLAAQGSQRFAATELERFDLHQPLLGIRINGQQFAFGTLNPLTQQQYVLTGNQVYLASARHMADAATTATDFIDKRLFGENESPVRFVGPARTLALQQGKWQVTPPLTGQSPDRLNAWLDEWRQASATLVQPYGGIKAASHLQIALRDGRQLRLDILQTQPELVLLRTDSQLQYHLPAELGKRLLAPLEAPPDARATGS